MYWDRLISIGRMDHESAGPTAYYAYRAEIFTRSVSRQDQSSLEISAQTDDPKWEITSEERGP
jgi:hypothetical protein